MMDLLRKFKAAACHNVKVYLLSRGKALKNPLTEEILAKSRVGFPQGTWNFDLMPPNTCIEAVVFGDGTQDCFIVTLLAMYFPVSNFGHKAIHHKVSEYVNIEQFKALMVGLVGATSAEHIDLAVMELGFSIEIQSRY